MHIAFIGLGIMGGRMAANLQKAGYGLTVTNRSIDKTAPLAEGGAAVAETPAAAAASADTVITMLADPPAVRETALGENGFLDAMRPGTRWVDCSTVNPSFTREMAGEAGRRQVRFVDAPVGGTSGPAERGELIFMAGGAPEDIEACRPLFDVMGKMTVHVGENGQGTALKMVVNMLLGNAMLAFAEAFTLGRAQGISKDLLLAVLPQSPVTAPFIALKKEKIEAGEFSAEFPLKWMHKDLGLVSRTADEAGVALRLEHTAKEAYAAAVAEGMGDLDFSAIIQAVADRRR